jgi:hypothetical protein
MARTVVDEAPTGELLGMVDVMELGEGGWREQDADCEAKGSEDGVGSVGDVATVPPWAV